MGTVLWGMILSILILTMIGAELAQAQPEDPPSPQGPAPPITHTLVGRSNCLICHATGFGDAAANPPDHVDYTNDVCEDCHEAAPGTTPPSPWSDLAPDALPQRIEHPPTEGKNSCVDCHLVLGETHTEISEQWQESVHGQSDVGCVECHGGDARTDEMNLSMDPASGFIGVPTRADIPHVCGSCHADVEEMRQYNLPTDQYVKYIESVHGVRLQTFKDVNVAVCTDCHGTHDVKKASDPTAAVYPLNVPELCASCHADPEYMASYNIPIDQFDIYKTSVHGRALLEDQDVRAPSCASCHGSHAAQPPDSEEVVNVCGKCHTATEAYYKESRHSRIGENAPKCWTCHGTHDVIKPDESMFLHEEPTEQECTTCHVDENTFRMDKARFANPEDRRCDTCHHENSMIMVQVQAILDALIAADASYTLAEETIQEAATRGMIVSDAENQLAQARTSLISARAAVHTTKLPMISQLTEDAIASAQEAYSIAHNRLRENEMRRLAMIIAVVVILINMLAFYALKRELYSQLD
ncbi:MAG: ammonia-forming cytochrome c nitrite reductase subunit c552 [Chloroflexi bacterium]|nr:ammonia-forming cytochrome c nitrite reductase subunit c552 [Chloroflexota bacterium]